MKVISNELRDITIEGVVFTPIDGGVTVPDDKIEAVKDNFFFKYYVEVGAFTIVEVKEAETEEVEAPKRGRKK